MRTSEILKNNMNSPVKLISLVFLLSVQALWGQRSPLLDSIWECSRVYKTIDSLHFSQTTLKSHRVKTLSVFIKDSYYSRENDSLYLMKKVEYNTSGYKLKRLDYNYKSTPEIYSFERDSNNCLLYSSEYKDGKWVLNEKNEYQNGLLSSEIRRFTSNVNKKITYKYDTKRNLIEKNEYCFDEVTICTTTKYNYNLNNQITREVYLNRNDSIYSQTNTIYDSLSRVVDFIEKAGSKEKHYHHHYTKRKDKLIILIIDSLNIKRKSEIIIYPDKWIVYHYYGKKVGQKTTLKFTSDGKITEVTDDYPQRKKSAKKRQLFCGYIPPRYQKTTIEYNEKGQLVSKKEFDSPKALYREIKYEYNEQGLLSKETEYEEGKIDDTWFYEYTYW